MTRARTSTLIATALVAGATLTLTAPRAQEAPPATVACVGSPAPDFTLQALDGSTLRLADLKGLIVVLEWFDPDSPWVAKHHATHATMRQLAAKWTGQVSWLAISSGRSAARARLAQARTEWSIPWPILLDEQGEVARRYAARTTPHMFVIDTRGVLRYAGAIDDDPGQSEVGRVNWVDRAVAAIVAGAAVDPATTEPYGSELALDARE